MNCLHQHQILLLMLYIRKVVEGFMKPYPLGLDNPYTILAIIGTTRWGLYRKDPFQKIAEFASEFQAYDARRAILKSEGYDA
jgi:hypothetical protein